MLVLSRRERESIMIGDEVELTVTQIRGGQVKLGFTAPGAVRIVRAEIWRRRRALGGAVAAVPAQRQ
jgi:carbon storage regulator